MVKMKPGAHAGPKNSHWKGGRRVRPDGYIDCYSPGHPYANRNRVLEHRLVMEKALGRYLEPHEIVHHKNEDKADNRLHNLELTDRPDHARHHFTGARYPDRFKPRVDRERLERVYLGESKTLRECAAMFGISYGSVRRHCIEFGIAIREKDPWLKRRGKTRSYSRRSCSSTSGKSSRSGSTG